MNLRASELRIQRLKLKVKVFCIKQDKLGLVETLRMKKVEQISSPVVLKFKVVYVWFYCTLSLRLFLLYFLRAMFPLFLFIVLIEI